MSDTLCDAAILQPGTGAFLAETHGLVIDGALLEDSLASLGVE